MLKNKNYLCKNNIILKCNKCKKVLNKNNEKLTYMNIRIGNKYYMFITCDTCYVRNWYEYKNTLFGKEIIDSGLGLNINKEEFNND